MITPTFAVARRTERIVNRIAELKKLEQAICQPGLDTRVVIIKAPGGLGKTRLLLETLWRIGHHQSFLYLSPPNIDEIWTTTTPVIISNIVDFSDVRLHTFEHFLQILRDSFSWHEQAQFQAYDDAVVEYKRKRRDQADYSSVEAAAAKAEGAFFEDYRQLAGEYRLVWALDTAEQLSYAGASWLWETGLLSPKDIGFSTQQRLLELLQQGKLPNTTILLAGRPEAEAYFEQLIEAAHHPDSRFSLETIELDVFNVEDVQTYLNQLAQDYQAQPGSDEAIAAHLQNIAQDQDRIKVLHLYTAGQPVRLALFVDILIEGKKEPVALQDTFAQAKERIQKEGLEKIQFEIEAEFIRLLFATTDDLRPRIMTALVRARHGLDAKRLNFILGSLPNADPAAWKTDPILNHEIEQELAFDNPYSLHRLSVVKTRADGRLILQDELYRIYAENMAANEIDRKDEAQARLQLYRKLQKFADWEIDQLNEIRTQIRKEDERSLHWESPARALSMKLRSLGITEEHERFALEEHVLAARLERLHYELRIDPDAGFNDTYYDIAEQMSRANDLEADVQIQIELWRFLTDPYTRAFINLPPRPSMVNDTSWDTLERAAIQDDVTRWIKRFFLTKQYHRAIEFADQVEQIIPALPEPLQKTLAHTFSRGERICWQEFSRVYLGENIPDAIARLETTAKQLERLLSHKGIPEQEEFSLLEHPAEIRLRRVIGLNYNFLGYGHVTQGHYRQAGQYYATALRYLRDTGFWARQAITRNNLSRVLSEMGLINRAGRICRDALELREELGFENPIAFSHNTLAVIYNNGRQPENAWPEAARAVVYFRKLEDPRGLGLALTELCEALRRLTTSKVPKVVDTPEELLDTAATAIAEAVEIFEQYSPEVMRRIEALIEQGCLYRDYMYYLKTHHPDQSSRITQYRNRAISLLKTALELSTERGFARHQLDAQNDLAWTYYYAGETEAAEQAIEDTLKLVPPESLLKKDSSPPCPTDAESYIFMQLGKVWAVRGRLRLDRFIKIAAAIRASLENKQAGRLAVRNDPQATKMLEQAAEAFVLSLGYNQLYSTRSTVISVSLDILYDYLKKFNRFEMTDFFKYQRQARAEYRIDEIEPEDPTDLEVFLLQSFGDYFEPVPGSPEEVK
ncbi:MAG: hypothetical protein JW953_21645 [Anaerolineae bacterium]|nr:hypothetical protein [Anaerolineae bacterium]